MVRAEASPKCNSHGWGRQPRPGLRVLSHGWTPGQGPAYALKRVKNKRFTTEFGEDFAAQMTFLQGANIDRCVWLSALLLRPGFTNWLRPASPSARLIVPRRNEAAGDHRVAGKRPAGEDLRRPNVAVAKPRRIHIHHPGDKRHRPIIPAARKTAQRKPRQSRSAGRRAWLARSLAAGT